jgi:hypothetical protein
LNHIVTTALQAATTRSRELAVLFGTSN